MENKPSIKEQRSYYVVKANEVVQTARYNLNIRELKILSYLISQIKPNDKPSLWYEFSIPLFCKVCGIDYTSGNNYNKIKNSLKGLRDKSFWIKQEDGSETTIGWLGKVNINRGSGKIKILFDEDLQQYITELYGNYTQYELFSTLPMQSSYSFRVYELLKSYQHKRAKFEYVFDVEDLKAQLGAPYRNFKDFRVKVINVATAEINQYTDLEVSWEPIKEGRKVAEIRFYVETKDITNRIETMEKVENLLDGIDYQTPIRDLLEDKTGEEET